jgi:hypothetical protein
MVQFFGGGSPFGGQDDIFGSLFSNMGGNSPCIILNIAVYSLPHAH